MAIISPNAAVSTLDRGAGQGHHGSLPAAVKNPPLDPLAVAACTADCMRFWLRA
jgi:hypothetical protein